MMDPIGVSICFGLNSHYDLDCDAEQDGERTWNIVIETVQDMILQVCQFVRDIINRFRLFGVVPWAKKTECVLYCMHSFG